MSTTVEYTAELIQSLADSSHSEQEWLICGRELAQADALAQTDATARQFAIGDWLIEGEEKRSRKAYDDAAGIFTNYKRVTLRNLANVARSVQTSLRNDVLSWSYHAAVARFAKAPETQKKLLAYAAEKSVSVSAFRKHINETYPPAKPANKTDRPGKLNLTLPADVMATVKLLAKKWAEPVESALCHLIERALELPGIKKKQCIRPQRQRSGWRRNGRRSSPRGRRTGAGRCDQRVESAR
jgi:hypothetical protein